MKLSPKTFIFFGLLSLCSCLSNHSIKEKFNENSQFRDTLQITSQVLNDSCIFIMPRQMEVIDSLIIILDAFRPDHFFYIYNTQGKFLKSFGTKGRGPGELLIASNFHSDIPNHTIRVYNPQKRSIIEYDLAKILNNEHPFFTECSVHLPQSLYPQEIIKFDSEKYLCCHRTPELRYTIQEQDQEKFSYTIYPQLEDKNDKHFAAAILNYAGLYRFSPDYSKFLEASYIGAIMDLFEISDNEMKPIQTCRIFYPQYKILDAENAQITWDEKTRIGFECIYATNNYIYSLLNGILGSELKNPEIQEPYTKNISVFDWQGTPQTLLKTNNMMNAICVDEEQRIIYALAYDKGEHSLIKLNL